MGSKSVKIVIIIAVILGIIAIVGITGLVVFTTKSSEPKIIDLNDSEADLVDEVETEDEETDEEESDNEEEISENNISDNEEVSNSDNNSSNSENSPMAAFYKKLEEYQGDQVSGDKLNELLDIIRRNNEQNVDYQIRAMANVQNWDSDNNKAKTDKNYKISFEKDEESKVIKSVKIEDAN